MKASSDFLESVQDDRIVDPLSEVTRRERKALLLTSLVALAVTKGGLIPSEISALGIKISAIERAGLLYLLSLALLYFILGFALYAAADLKAYRVRVARVARSRKQVIQETLGPGSSRGREAVSKATEQRDYSAVEQLAQLADSAQLAQDVLTVSRLRYLFEYYLPLVVGGGAVVLTLLATRGLPGSLLMNSLAATVGLALVVAYFIQAHRRLRQRWRFWKQNRPMRRVQKQMRKASRLPADSEERKKAVEEVSRLLKEMGQRRPKTEPRRRRR